MKEGVNTNTNNTAVLGTLHLPSATNPLCKQYFSGMG
jgi:hypothetical protein